MRAGSPDAQAVAEAGAVATGALIACLGKATKKVLVTNVGTRATRENAWYDRVFLSIDQSLDFEDYLFEREAAPGEIIAAEFRRLAAVRE